MEQCVEMKELKKTNFDLKESLESRDTQIERLNKAVRTHHDQFHKFNACFNTPLRLSV